MIYGVTHGMNFSLYWAHLMSSVKTYTAHRGFLFIRIQGRLAKIEGKRLEWVWSSSGFVSLENISYRKVKQKVDL